MKIRQLTDTIKCSIIGDDVDVKSLALSHNDCKDGSIFFCIKGNNCDGEAYIDSAAKNGAVAVVTTRPIDCSLTDVVVKDVRKAMNAICKRFYSDPQKKLKLIGVVGTDGKTSVCELTCQMLNEAGVKCGKIGTNGAFFDGKEIDTGMTTPDPPLLYKLLSEMVAGGVKAVCMELSVHAIYYKKADFVFDILIFTNCTRDHLDFFGSIEQYRRVKASAFVQKNCRLAVVNADDPLGLIIALKRKTATITYGIDQPSDTFAVDIKETAEGMCFIINLFDKLYDLKTKLIGRFNVYNLLAAATACALCGLKTDYIAEKIPELGCVRGRMQRVHSMPNVYIDYAHTPDGLENALSALKKSTEGKLICVFGCGGNRDYGKRKEMGKISGRLADLTVITCDNSRFEDVNAIINEIEKGVREVDNVEYVTISDRKLAIEYALRYATVADTVLIAGKGCECYQEVMGVKIPFSDEETACAYYKNKE